MPLITLQELSVRFRGPPLLDNVTSLIEPGDRIGLLGRNGSGKTTLMRILCGAQEPDRGTVRFAAGAKVSLLPQDVPADLFGPIATIVASDHESEWQSQRNVDDILGRMQLDGSRAFETLSSGMKRRVLLARALVTKPDLLLLDEPTNHLDIDAITWLEDFLQRWNGTLMFVTHDRMFLQKLARRIWELDRGRLFDWTCDYETFLVRKDEALAAEEKQNALFDKKLAEEEVWIRQGVKARRTRNEGRVRALEQMRRVRSERREVVGKVKLEIQEAARSGALVAQLEQVRFAYADRPILDGFSGTVMRGDKIGIIGPNGAGKSTLLKILLGQLPPQAGTVRLGTNLQIAYFDQLREQLDDEKSVQENVGDGYDTIKIGGQSRHVIGYLRDFLFSAERARTPVKFLSGGERNRVLLARLFAKPANIIVLDEPTNDLDAETLELLEQRLVDFPGTVLVVSHDRAFLNAVATSTLVFEASGVREYVGGYDDWLRQRPAPPSDRSAHTRAAATDRPAAARTAAERNSPERGSPERGSTDSSAQAAAAPPRKLTYKEQRELEALPGRIEALEKKLAELHVEFADPGFYKQPGERIAARQAELTKTESELNAAMERWMTLET
ncbi:MAG: transporter ATP-binding protein uup [Planctomycetota bacterium]